MKEEAFVVMVGDEYVCVDKPSGGYPWLNDCIFHAEIFHMDRAKQYSEGSDFKQGGRLYRGVKPVIKKLVLEDI